MIQGTPNSAYINYKVPSGAILDPEKQVVLKDSLIQTKDTLTKSTDNNPAVKAAQDTSNDPKVLAGAVGIWGLLQLIVKPINKAISGTYEDSLLGKIGKFGDKISDALHLESVTKHTNGITSKIKDSRIFKYFRAPYKTASKNSFAASMANGTIQELASDAKSVIEACKKQAPELFAKFGSEMDNLLLDPMKNATKIADLLRKAGPDDLIQFGGKVKLPFIKEFPIPGFQRTVRYSELANKLTTITKTGAKTGLGKNMSKGFLRTMEGLTNGMAGGAGAMLIQAFCFAQATKAAINAPKGEKLSTFMENVFQDLGYYLVGASSINLMHRAAGNKYRGMSKAAVNEYKNILKQANEDILKGTEVNVKLVKKQLKDLLKGKDVTDVGKTFAGEFKLNFLEKPLKWAGKLLGSGLDKLEPVIKSTDKAPVKMLKKLGSKLKGFPGGLGRFALSMFVITPFLVKPVVKLSHLIFGRPTKSVLDKEPDTKANDVTAAPNSQQPNSAPQSGSTNYLDKYTNQPQTPQPQVNSAAPMAPVAEDEIAARKIKKDNNDNNEPVRTYVPSSAPTQFTETGEDYSKINDIMHKADVIEREVLKNI